MKLAFLDLPDERADLIPLARRAEGIEIVLVVHPDPEALSLKLAHALGIPRSSEPLDLLALKPDKVALPAPQSPSAAALTRAGISDRIFSTLDDLEADSRMAELLDALDRLEKPEHLLGEMLESALHGLEADSGSIFLLDEDAKELRTAVTCGWAEESVGARHKLGEGMVGQVAESGTPAVTNGQDPTRPAGRSARDRYRPHLAIPLRDRDRILGVFRASRFHADRVFSEADVGRAAALASRMTRLLGRASLLERHDADATELHVRRSLEEIFQGSSWTDEERLRLAAERLRQGLGALAVRLHIADSESTRLTVFASDAPSGPEGILPLGDGLVAGVFRSGEPLLLTSDSGGRSARESESPPALILAPIRNARNVGVMGVESPRRVARDLDERTRRIARLGRDLARLIEAGKEGETARRDALLSKLVDAAPRLLFAPDVRALLAEMAQCVRDLFGPRGLVSARLLALTERGGNEEVVLTRSFAGESDAERESLLAFDQELTSLVLGHGIESSSIPGGAREGSRASDTEYLAVPIRSSARTIGSLGVSIPKAGRSPGRLIGPAELEAVRRVAWIGGIAWERGLQAEGEPARAHDPVTGLLGGSGLEARILEEVKRAERYHNRILLTLCSISGYESLIQRHGLAWGERLVREFARALSRNVREVDVVGRIEGGRFAILSPETERDGSALLRRLDQILPELEVVRTLPDGELVVLVGRQYTFPDDVPTGADLLQLVRSSYTVR
jgi:diguanylate cyclase (GGDEF)-like protein